MSILAYATLTNKRDDAMPGTSTTVQAPGVKTWMDSFASLVPAEVLAAHAFLLSAVTTTDNSTGSLVTKITDPTLLKAIFYALVGVSILIYVVGRRSARAWDRLDFIRMLIPALAFVGWTMLQKATGFDAAFPNVAWKTRLTIAVIGGIVLGLVASQLAYKADQTNQGNKH